ncbi:V-type ATP synthase subunit F [Enterococcus sp. DIV0876]|uniref:V-type ATP synthase subunit F n=1 Tax=Enterococcus sp. DIV0876 TaxID=2774633 RepID=UPI003D3000BD
MANNIGVIGEKESVLPFQLFGFQVHYATSEAEVRAALKQLAERCTILYLTEKCGALVPELLAKYQQQVSPAIILIPDYDGSKGLGLRMIQENVEKAVGQNIL